VAINILMVGNFFRDLAGAFSQCQALGRELERGGFGVVRTSRRRSRVLRFLDMLGTAVRRRRDYHVAIVDVFSGGSFLWAEKVVHLLANLRKPTILILHGGNLPTWSASRARRVWRVFSKVAAVTSPSRYLQEAMRPYCGDVILIRNGIEVSAYPFRRRSPAQPRLIWLRAFHRMYNPSLAIEVLARISEQFPAATLSMIGPDKGDGSLQECVRRAQQLGVSDRVTFAGAVPKDEVPKHLDAADIFLNTTNVDNAPVSVVEALACGLCVVSTNVGGLPFLLEDEKDALLVPAEDADRMAYAVGRVLRDEALAGRLSLAAREKGDCHDWSVVMPQWRVLLDSLGRNTPSGDHRPSFRREEAACR
jgi:glycosyltransferase involved in cell wall biosynthesis